MFFVMQTACACPDNVLVLQNIPENGVNPIDNPISPSEFFAALQIFDALAVDQNLPFDLINALQVWLLTSRHLSCSPHVMRRSTMS